jgi:EAL domain-containing protein (putative c-di-GMP-specific phosphodiesterase class I)
LIVDDEPQVCADLTNMLSGTEYDIVCTDSGLDAKQRLSEQDFDVVVSNVQIPGLNGIELLRAVREHHLDLPVILISGAPDLTSAMQAVEYGALRYLEKPVARQAFRDVVARAVKLHDLARLKRRSLAALGLPSRFAADVAGMHRQFDRALSTLRMEFQPIVRHADARPWAYEALVRPRDETLSNPSVLLDAAERLDQITLLGRVIRGHVACEIPSFFDHELLFVNIHPRELEDDALYAPREPLSRHAHRVVLEITERSRLDDVPQLDQRIARLRDMGYRIALDDLGAGYAGLSSLMHLTPEFVKLDMSLTRDIDRHAVKRTLVESMIKACRDMGIQVVCEGVETEAEREVLQSLGADLMQGFLFGRPAPRGVVARLAAIRPPVHQR